MVGLESLAHSSGETKYRKGASIRSLRDPEAIAERDCDAAAQRAFKSVRDATTVAHVQSRPA